MSRRKPENPAFAAKGRVERGLEALRVTLGAYVERNMRKRYGGRWRQFASRSGGRTARRRIGCLRAVEDGARPLAGRVLGRLSAEEGAKLRLARDGCAQQRRALRRSDVGPRGDPLPGRDAGVGAGDRRRRPSQDHCIALRRAVGRGRRRESRRAPAAGARRTSRSRSPPPLGAKSASHTRTCSAPVSPTPSSLRISRWWIRVSEVRNTWIRPRSSGSPTRPRA